MLQIRKYVSTDQSTLIKLLRQNTPKYFAPDEEEDFITYLDSEVEDYFVIEYDNHVIGAGGINYKSNGTVGLISWDIISSQFQGMGVGSVLLSHRLDILQSKSKINQIIVRTTQHVYPFYEKHGFELVETSKDYWAIGFDLYHMEINIS